MSGYLDLEGKRALVTGGTKGVGHAVSPRYTMPASPF
jgi:NAD(P)-dependent dehydrogenase (short-subunit alcohol dehydrogenase family)